LFIVRPTNGTNKRRNISHLPLVYTSMALEQAPPKSESCSTDPL
jgi:hypothetical protein